MTDLISIIVPIYRVEAYLEQCIQSILNQTYKKLEIILVDDGSDDKCPQICDYYAQIDKRIKVIHKKNGGIDSARKAGMLISTGKYIGYVDGDDWIEPEMYESLLNYACKYNVDVVESGMIDSWINREKNRVLYLEEGCYKGQDFIEQVETKILYAGVFFEYGIAPYTCSKLFLKDKIIKYQMMEGITNITHDDIMICLPCIVESKSIYVTHNCYYHYRARNDSLKRKLRKNVIPNLFESYSEFYKRFEGSKLCLDNDKQIKYFVMYWLLYKAPYAFDSLSRGDFLTQFGKVKIEDRIILYGAGAAGIQLKNYICEIRRKNIICWADQNYKDLQRGLNVINPKEILDYDYDYILISILREKAVQSAKKDLIKLGIPEEKILWIEQKYIDNPELLLSKVTYKGKTLL